MKETEKSRTENVWHFGYFDTFPEPGLFLPRVQVFPRKEIPKEAVPELIREAIGFDAGVQVCIAAAKAAKDRPIHMAIDESGIAWRMEGPVFPDEIEIALEMAEAVAAARTGRWFQRFRVALIPPADMARVQWPMLGEASLYASIRDMVEPRIAHEASLSSKLFRHERPFATVVACDGLTWRFGSEIVIGYFEPAMKLLAAITALGSGGAVKHYHVDVGLPENIEWDPAENHAGFSS